MKLDGFGIMVDDMATLVRFYRDVLGFERTCYIADPEGNLIEIGSFKEV